MGGYSYILDCFPISIYISNCTLCSIYYDFCVFFTSTPVNSVLYHMLILIYQQHLIVDDAISCVLLQIFPLIIYLIDLLFLSFFFLQLVFIMLYLIIIYISLVIMLLPVFYSSFFLALALPLSLILFWFQYSYCCALLFSHLMYWFVSSCLNVIAQLDFILLDIYSIVHCCSVVLCIGLRSLSLLILLYGLFYFCSII